ncbi:MAG: EthD family reductase [Gammaproteobacteria bacterium]|jgi:uncharacterized protein (TIGR02118 family)|nr:EthD family reductase [Gammaproteobacteria bacterium]
MSIIYLLEIHRDDKSVSSLSNEQVSKLVSSLTKLPGLSGLLMFIQAEGGHDPVLKDENPPLLVFQALFNDKESLHKALSSSEFEDPREQLLALSANGIRVLQEAMLFEPYLSSATENGLADLSYLVNYQRPAENETEFLQYYRAHHPAILKEFPDIRRVELGTPIDWKSAAGIERADRMLYCEVSFDNIEKLNVALDSEKRKELRKDYDCFPPFSGEVTHFPMHRKVII